jgi:hypothetical protein
MRQSFCIAYFGGGSGSGFCERPRKAWKAAAPATPDPTIRRQRGLPVQELDKVNDKETIFLAFTSHCVLTLMNTATWQ